MSYPKKKKHRAAQTGKTRGWMLPLFYLVLSFLLMILPLEGLVNSVKAVLSYIFIPQIRLSHSAVKYAQGVSSTVQELLNAHPWKGTWATIAYREPSQWNTVIIDKGSQDGIEPRSAVIAVENGVEGLAGEVVEVTENTAKVLLVRDEDFTAAAFLSSVREEGLLVGGGNGPVLLKYVPLLSQVKLGDKVYTSAASSIFPAGILVGEVSAVRRGESFQTALTVEVTPAISSSTLKEVFVILHKDKKKK